MPRATAAGLALIGILAAARAHAVTYEAGPALKAFELANSGNLPGVNGAWSYGTTRSAVPVPAGGTPSAAFFTPFPGAQHRDAIQLPGVAPGDLQGWQEDLTGDLVPAVAVNVKDAPVPTSCCGSYQDAEMWLHADPGGSLREFVVVRWTAPEPGTADYLATFFARGGTPTGVSVLVDGVPAFVAQSHPEGTIDGANGFVLAAGGTIDFVVGPTPTGNYGGTSTGFFGTINFTAVPEPASVAAALALFLVGWRDRHGR